LSIGRAEAFLIVSIAEKKAYRREPFRLTALSLVTPARSARDAPAGGANGE